MSKCCKEVHRRHKSASSGILQDCACYAIGGLLCSSCCLIQLGLNSLSIGCAGFSVLTPYRPAFVAVTLISLVGNYVKYRNKRRTAIALAIAFGLGITPELVQAYNKGRVRLLTASDSRIMSTGPEAPLRLKVEGLKCEACSARLKKHILSSASVRSCEIDFALKQMTVRGDISDASKIVNAVENLGYSASTIPD